MTPAELHRAQMSTVLSALENISGALDSDRLLALRREYVVSLRADVERLRNLIVKGEP